MATLTVELGITMAIAPSEGLVIRLVERIRGEYREVETWRFHGRSATSPEIEDVLSSVSRQILEHLIVGPGVQLTLHD